MATEKLNPLEKEEFSLEDLIRGHVVFQYPEHYDFSLLTKKDCCNIPSCHKGLVPDGTTARKSCKNCEEKNEIKYALKTVLEFVEDWNKNDQDPVVAHAAYLLGEKFEFYAS